MTSQTSFTIKSFVTPVFPLGTILAVIAPLLALGFYMIISMKRKAAIAN
jgi:hypothetical protein